MRITQEADYALRVVLHLSKLGYGNKIEGKIIAAEEEIPLRFLLKMLRKLNAKGITRSFRGANGGYAINKQPDKITMREVIEAIDGPISVNKCVLNPRACNANKVGKCAVHKAMVGVQEKLIDELESITFMDLLKDNNRNILN